MGNKISVTTEYSEERINHLLELGMQGAQYWASFHTRRRRCPPPRGIWREYGWTLWQDQAGKSVEVEWEDRDGRHSSHLTREDVARGLTVLARDWPRHWASFVGCKATAETGDMFVQCCVFGEQRYWVEALSWELPFRSEERS